MLELSATKLAELIRGRQASAVEVVSSHFERIAATQESLNAVVCLLEEQAMRQARAADEQLARGETIGRLHGVPFSVKDSIDVAGVRSTAGTLGRRAAPPAERDATLVSRLRAAGGIPIVKTNLPDLLFSFETDNLIFGRTNNPYDLSRTPGGSSGGESALIAACGSPLGLGSDCLGSVRVPAAFCGITSIKPTSGRLARTGHVPALGGWVEALWQIGPMARRTEDLVLAMELLTGEDDADWTAPPVPLLAAECVGRMAFFVDNGIAACDPGVKEAVRRCAALFESRGVEVVEQRPPAIEQCYELELALLGADGVDGIDAYLREAGSMEVHPLLTNFTDRMRPFRTSAEQFAKRWAQWDRYRAEMRRFFQEFDVVLCPTYVSTALRHRESMRDEKFRGFSYTMAWSVAGYPAATVRCGEADGLPINVQIVAKPWRDLTAVAACRLIEAEFGGWKPAC